MRFNPFHNIFESSAYPNARTLRTSLGVKFRDSFNVIYGNTLTTDSEKARMGLFDYATAFIPAALNRWEAHLDRTGSWGMLPLAAINLVHKIPRFILSGVAAVLAFPITWLTHSIARGVDNSREQSLRNALGIEVIDSTKTTLATFMSAAANKYSQGEHRSMGNIEDLRAEITENGVEITAREWKSGQRSDPVTVPFSNKHCSALFSHNIGGVVSGMTKEDMSKVVPANLAPKA